MREDPEGLPLADPLAGQMICARVGCGKVVPPKKRAAGRPKKYCSRKCATSVAKVAHRAQKKARGVCTVDGCNEPTQDGHVRCAKHKAADAAAKVAHRAQKKARGVCTVCGCNEPTQNGHALCAKHKAAHAAARATYDKANPEKRNAKSSRRRAKKKNSPGSHTGAERKDLMQKYGCMCVYCQVKPAEHLDHIVPLARGGSDDISNMNPACESCNCSKGAKLLWVEWTPSNPHPTLFTKYIHALKKAA